MPKIEKFLFKKWMTIPVSFLLACGSVQADTTNCLTPPGDLVGWWPAEGDATDLATYNNGTLHDGVSFAAGKVGLAFQFDGTTGHILVPNSTNLDLRPEATYAAWINLSQLPSQVGHVLFVVGKSQPGNDLDIQVEGENRVHFYLGPAVSIASSSMLQTGVWYFVAATYRVYLACALSARLNLCCARRARSGCPTYWRQSATRHHLLDGLCARRNDEARLVVPGQSGNLTAPMPATSKAKFYRLRKL